MRWHCNPLAITPWHDRIAQMPPDKFARLESLSKSPHERTKQRAVPAGSDVYSNKCALTRRFHPVASNDDANPRILNETLEI